MVADGRGRDRPSAGSGMRRRAALGAAILAGLAATFQVWMFPPHGWAWLAWVALVPLLVAIWTGTGRAAIGAGGIFGSLAALGLVTGWLWPALTEFFGLALGVRVGLLALAVLYGGGLSLAVFGAALGAGARLAPPVRVLLAAATWAAVEYGRGQLPYGMLWAPLGAALAPDSVVAQVADLGGVYAVSFVVVTVNAALAELILAAVGARRARRLTQDRPSAAKPPASARDGVADPSAYQGDTRSGSAPCAHGAGGFSRRRSILGQPPRPRRDPEAWRGALLALGVAAVVVIGACGYGAARRADVQHRMATAPTARVALVHAELENARRQGAARAAAALDRYLALSPAAGTVDLVVWPENAVNLLLEDNPELVARIAARAGATPYVVGAPRTVATGSGYTLRTSALVIADGGLARSYDKRRLLPFAEMMPSLRGRGAAQPQIFLPGTAATVVTVGSLRIGPLICYEAIFPELARTTVRAGADLLVNLSNDSWFPPGAGPAQHARFAELRAVELRRTLVRAANRGVTMVVLPDGRVPLATDGATPGAEIATVPLLTIPTVYARIGDGFAWLCVVAVGLGLARSRFTATPC